MEYLDRETNKAMAIILVQSVFKNNTHIATADEVDALFELAKGLMKDFDGTIDDEVLEPYPCSSILIAFVFKVFLSLERVVFL
jgi:hypothetical protein